MENMPSQSQNPLEDKIRARAEAQGKSLTPEQIKLSAELISAKLAKEGGDEETLIDESIEIRRRAAEAADAVSHMKISTEDGTVERGS